MATEKLHQLKSVATKLSMALVTLTAEFNRRDETIRSLELHRATANDKIRQQQEEIETLKRQLALDFPKLNPK